MNKSFKHVLGSLLAKLMSALLVVGAIFALYSLNSTTVHATDISNLIAESNGNQEIEDENGQEDTVYYINFYFDGELVGTQEAYYGDSIEFPEVPATNSYGDLFACWDTDNETVVGDEDIYAVFLLPEEEEGQKEKEEEKEEEWILDFHTVNDEKTVWVTDGEKINAPELPDGYRWTPEVPEYFTPFAGYYEFFAVPESSYRIVFNMNGYLNTQIVAEGEAIVAPEVNDSDFICWDHEVTIAECDDTFNAIYNHTTFTINFYFDGELVGTQEAHYGDPIEFPTNVPISNKT